MNENLGKQITLLKYSISNRNLLRQIQKARRNLLLDSQALRNLQWRKVSDLLSFAYSNCPFYREKYSKAGIRPEDIKNFGDFSAVPELTKEEIRNNLERMIPVGAKRDMFEVVHTGGTTGVPMKVFRDGMKSDLMQALYLRTISYWHCDIGSRTVWVWGIPKDEETHRDFEHQKARVRWLKNVTWFNAFNMTQDRIAKFLRFLYVFKPTLIIGYVSVLCELAKFIAEHRVKVWPPKAIWITAEPSNAHQRKLMEDAFQSNTFNEYGSTEILRIAAECSARQGLHLNADSRYVEILDSHSKAVEGGDIGNIVITDLENRVMPILRYRNGDIASWSDRKCKCGLNLPMISAVHGRSYDIIRVRGGRGIYGHLFSRILFKYQKQIRQFQVRQTSIDNVDISIVPSDLKAFQRVRKDIVAQFRIYTDDTVRYSFHLVNEIAREKSGKLCYVKSDLH